MKAVIKESVNLLLSPLTYGSHNNFWTIEEYIAGPVAHEFDSLQALINNEAEDSLIPKAIIRSMERELELMNKALQFCKENCHKLDCACEDPRGRKVSH